MEVNFFTDNDTFRLLKIVSHFLITYFGYDPNIAVSMVNEYYHTWMNIHDDDIYHDLGAFGIGIRVHYFTGLNLKEEDFIEWKKVNQFLETPSEALEYFRKNYYVK